MIDTTMMNAAPAARRGVRLLLLGMLVALAGTLTLSVWAQTPAQGMAPGMMSGMSPGTGHGMAPGMRHGMRHGMEPGMMFGGSPERIGRMVDRMLDGLNATDAQRSQIKQIAQSAAADLKAQREAGKGQRERALQLFAAPTVDTAALEALRQQMLAQHDQASKRVMQAMLDAAKVLTPEQRAKFAERMQMRSAQRQDRMQRMQRERPAQK